MLAIEGASVIDGEIVGDHLLLTKHDGTQIDAGSVVGPQGPAGPAGPAGDLGAVSDWPWGSGQIPSGTVLPYGQQLTAAAYPALQAIADAAGRPYGGNAGVNFNAPDYRGRIGAGKDDMGGTAANRITAAVSGMNGTTLGVAGGAEGITLTTAQLPAHNHGMSGQPGFSDPGHSHVQSGSTVQGGPGAVGGGVGNNQYLNANTGIATTGILSNIGTIGTSNTGSGSAHSNVQPSIIVNKIMRVL
jgi:microcystin-dependent protein